MRVSDLAKELNITEEAILAKLKTLKLKAKGETQELNAVVEIVLLDEFAKEGIVSPKKSKALSDEEKPKKAKAKTTDAKKAKAPAKTKAKKSKDEAQEQEEPVKGKSVKGKVEAPKVQQEPLKKEGDIKAAATKPVPVQPKPAPVPAAVVEKPKEAPKPAPVAEAPKPAVAVQELPKIHTPIQDITKKKVTRSAEPFITVKPLAKKRKRPMPGDTGGYSRPETRTDAAAPAAPAVPLSEGPLTDIEIRVPISVKDLAVRLNQKTNVILKQLMSIGIFANINQSLGEDIVTKLAKDFGFNLVMSKTQEEQLVLDHRKEQEDSGSLKLRAPVVTFMGHVDHGKTSLLDRIRSSKIADKEHGGITQHVGAYSVDLPKGTITFLDTPGHEAFTAMRARGATITDLVVLVVAADEGIMPQTEEAINHARAANVPIIVAMNKMDRKNADPDKVKKQLAEHDLASEDWGGKTIVVGVSAHTGEGIDELLEMILLQAEIMELKANYEKKAHGIVVEAHLSSGRGAVATLIVQGGILKENNYVVVGPHYGKIKAMFDDRGRPVKDAGPSKPVEVLGLPEAPVAGEMFYVAESEKEARDIANNRMEKAKEQKLSSQTRITLEDLYAQIQKGVVKELNVILKADVQGSLEAVRDSLAKIPSDEVRIRFIHSGVGDVNTGDVLLAKASDAIIIAFNIGIDANARQELEKTEVDVRQYRIIYDAVNDLRQALEGLLAPKMKRKFLGRVEIRQVMKLSKSGVVAGCYVQKGKVRSRSQVDVMRNGEVVFTGNVSSLKRFKDDVKEVSEDFECGVTIAKFDDYQVGDIIEVFEVEQIARKL